MKKSGFYLLYLFIVVFVGWGYANSKSEGESSPKPIQSTPLGKVQMALNEGSARLLEQKAWVLESYGNTNNLQIVAVLGGSEITAIFDFDPASMSGYGGCNWHKARFKIDGDTISIEPQMFTRRACLSQDHNKQELAYFKALDAAERYQIDGNRLQIFYANTSVLSFKGVSDEELIEQMRAGIPF